MVWGGLMVATARGIRVTAVFAALAMALGLSLSAVAQSLPQALPPVHSGPATVAGPFAGQAGPTTQGPAASGRQGPLAEPGAIDSSKGNTRIRSVEIEGAQRIEVETVKSYLALSEGDTYDSDRADRSLKTLYATGLFSDVTIRLEGDRLIVKVLENPIINRLAFEGNKKIKDENLRSEVQLKPRLVFSRTKVQADVKRLLDVYRRSGRFAATVEPKVVQLDQNRVDLIFEINEGAPTYVYRINFVGNRFFPESELKQAIQTREERWWRFMTSDDTYDPDRVNYDRELLRRLYLKNGFADFRVSSAVAELTSDREAFFVTYTLEEGARYKYGNTRVDISLKDVKASDLQPLITARKGEWYNGDEVEKIVQNMTDALGTRGFAFADVRPGIKRNEKTHIVDIVFEVKDGPKVYVDRIDITGNVRTLDRVIRREFALVEGDAFNTAKIRRTQQRLKDLGYFEKVDITNTPSEAAPDKTTVKAVVTEKSTGELSFGAGFSTVAGPMINVSVRERNFLGRGQEVSVSGAIGFQLSQVQLSFTEPYFLDRSVSAGFDVFRLTRNLQTQSGYDFQTLGFSLRSGYYLAEYLSQAWKYTLKQDQVADVSQGASIYVLEQAGYSMLSSIQETLAYDRRDSRIDPGKGYMIRVTDEVAGPGGDQYFARDAVGLKTYYTLADQFVLSSSADAGLMSPFNTHGTRIAERYFLGGDTLRGFAYYGIGPRDYGTGAALGGLWEAYGSTQLRFPIGLPKDFGVLGEVFTDYGTVGQTDQKSIAGSYIEQNYGLRAASGVGISWKSPMGPIAIDFSIPWMKEDFDKTQIVKFNFGQRF